MMSDVDYATIPAPNGVCVICGKCLASLGKHPSVLKLSDQGVPERRDVCRECWETVADKDFYSFWVTQREAPKPDLRRTRQQQRAALMRLFEQFHASGDPQFRPHVYLLAHLLMKHRQLVWEGEARADGGEPIVLFRHPVTGDLLRVAGVSLDDERLVAVKREIDAAVAVEAMTSVEDQKEKPSDEAQ